LRQLERAIKDLVPEFFDILWVYGSPQIRHAGTLAGNIANGSPIADSPPFLFVMDAEVEVTGLDGVRRIAMADFYTGYKPFP
jgi:xanthine dehydrogenase small subunit